MSLNIKTHFFISWLIVLMLAKDFQRKMLLWVQWFIGRTDAEAEAPILWPHDAKNWLNWKDSDAGKDWGQEEKGTTEDEMVGWHHWLNGHGFGSTLGVGNGQGDLACCGSWVCSACGACNSCKELDMTERLNWTELSNLPSKTTVYFWDLVGCKNIEKGLSITGGKTCYRKGKEKRK